MGFLQGISILWKSKVFGCVFGFLVVSSFSGSVYILLELFCFSESVFCFLELFLFSISGLEFLEVLSVLWKCFGFSGSAFWFS